jgi:hypothetical protein
VGGSQRYEETPDLEYEAAVKELPDGRAIFDA